ncbi:nucleotidyltransferase [Lacticaseibacillus saniviri JCM 17471 = DSM 24301]|uniref:tRNA(Met) cytidine acetate ligase n=2 Tax=Lacticaseibacillus saniviri TaxID=931533 RepID=A0A0R2N184_9LACO|nr:nucleotidyltransferase [Lacticaseibacillus saniviri]KRO18530.1 nucleotidyltransferase [Lacticaseibacillus saniviri JCM 17471 = DSM 24301]MCG4282030.1 nucleotidyltransferase [Lacticaseibacillus saniviri]
MMHAVGLIAEFNPLHSGHQFALQKARQLSGADAVVVVMSGNFVQRGEPAILDKWQRTQLALDAGADVVVELPVTSSVQAADQFAEGAIDLLRGLNVHALAFGSEQADLDYLQLAKDLADISGSQNQFRQYNQTFATQLNEAIVQQTGQALTAPNTMLGLAYARATLAKDWPMALYPFARQGRDHDDPELDAHSASASAIRHALRQQQPVPEEVLPAATQAMIERLMPLNWTTLFPLLRYRLQTTPLSQLRAIYTMSEGLEYRLVQQLRPGHDFDAFLEAIKSKRYTYARLRRLALYTVLNLTQNEMTWAAAHPVLHVLGFSAAGRAYLHQEKKQINLPLITKVNAAMLQPDGELNLVNRADQLLENQTNRAQNYGRLPIMLRD